MNDSFVKRQAERLARRVEHSAGGSSDTQVVQVFRLALGREPQARKRKRRDVLWRISGCPMPAGWHSTLASFCTFGDFLRAAHRFPQIPLTKSFRRR